MLHAENQWIRCRRLFLEHFEASPWMSRQQNSPASWVSSHQGQHSSLFHRRPERSESVWATSQVSPIVSTGSRVLLELFILCQGRSMFERCQAMWWIDDWRYRKKINDFKSEGLYKLKKPELFKLWKVRWADRHLTLSVDASKACRWFGSMPVASIGLILG